jgi:hypothetical protein
MLFGAAWLPCPAPRRESGAHRVLGCRVDLESVWLGLKTSLRRRAARCPALPALVAGRLVAASTPTRPKESGHRRWGPGLVHAGTIGRLYWIPAGSSRRFTPIESLHLPGEPGFGLRRSKMAWPRVGAGFSTRER